MSSASVVAAVGAEVAHALGADPLAPTAALVWRAVTSGDATDAGVEAVAVGRAWHLNGRVVTVVDPNQAVDELIVVSRSRPFAGRERGLRVHRVDLRADGIRTSAAPLLDGVALTVTLDGAEVTDENALGPSRDATAALTTALDAGAVLAVDAMLEAASTALDVAARWVAQREQFGAPLAARQAVQHRLADMAIAVTAVQALADDAKQQRSAGRPFAVEAATAKLLASERLPDVTAGAHQLHGGEGYYADRPLHALHRRVLTLATLLGDAERQRRRLAELFGSSAYPTSAPSPRGEPSDSSSSTSASSSGMPSRKRSARRRCSISPGT
jgi:alkylation response protein AidB-like acyl-CoA dehydrogenase